MNLEQTWITILNQIYVYPISLPNLIEKFKWWSLSDDRRQELLDSSMLFQRVINSDLYTINDYVLHALGFKITMYNLCIILNTCPEWDIPVLTHLINYCDFSNERISKAILSYCCQSSHIAMLILAGCNLKIFNHTIWRLEKWRFPPPSLKWKTDIQIGDIYEDDMGNKILVVGIKEPKDYNFGPIPIHIRKRFCVVSIQNSLGKYMGTRHIDEIQPVQENQSEFLETFPKIVCETIKLLEYLKKDLIYQISSTTNLIPPLVQIVNLYVGHSSFIQYGLKTR